MAKSEVRMNRSTPPLPDWEFNWQDQFTIQLVGLALAIVGAILFLSLRSTESLPWLVGMTGWTAPLVALSLMLVGGVLVLGDRAGYWSIEALLGGELLLLGLQAGAFVWYNPLFEWNMKADGSNGGLVGWVVGGLLVAGFGQGVATVLVGMICGAGLFLIIRHTPLIYPAAYLLRYLRWMMAYWSVWSVPRPRSQRQPMPHTPLPRTANFVTPQPVRKVRPAPAYEDHDDQYDEEADDQDESYVAPTPPRRRRSTPPAQPVPAVPPTSQPAAKRNGRTPKPAPRPATLPPYDLLTPDSGHYGSVDVDVLQAAIEGTLSDFGVPVRVVHVESGPTVTQFGVEPLYTEQSGKRRKVRVNRI
ncbi:MAG: hypothetical protein IT328_17035, partial [Caldilineaceae bacterium]|nr:hypothetical protein [Caldilineaceae bacterium]